jgi:RES domain-containing protein
VSARRRVAGTFFRVLTPRWAHQGGRYNRPGAPALYMSRDLETAWAEYQQTGALVRPGTVVAYEVAAVGIADLADPEVLADLGGTEADLLALWRDIARVEGRDPPTWMLADRLRGDGCNGLLAPSAARPGGVNLVLWRWGETGPVRVVHQDPGHDLPRDQASWR